MRFIEGYAIVASLVTLWASALVVGASRRRGPSRGPGGAQAVMALAGLWFLAVLHGSIVSGIALSLGRTPFAWAAAGVHGVLIGVVLVRLVFKV